MKTSLHTAILVALIRGSEDRIIEAGLTIDEARKASADTLLRTFYRYETKDPAAEKDAINELFDWLANRDVDEAWEVGVGTDIQTGEWLKGGFVRTVSDVEYSESRRNLLASVLVARFISHLKPPCTARDDQETRDHRREQLEEVFGPALYFSEMILSSDPGIVGNLLRQVGECLAAIDPGLFDSKYRSLPENTSILIRQQLLKGYIAAIGEETVYTKFQEKA